MLKVLCSRDNVEALILFKSNDDFIEWLTQEHLINPEVKILKVIEVKNFKQV